ncbi:glycan biosynthesis hexose transferase WsfD [Amycolatopsis samaneae]|uniref:Glycosyltransferase RgtA/B/C/D-like domain-containing protein n=1 Tax=Amycolatopsis samaneae TaxID=664691 RepID=A0ABW5GMD0_9PSEU
MVWRELRLGLGVLITSAGVLLVRFLVPRPVGMADNGDGWRLLCQLGAKEADRPAEKFVRFAYHSAPACDSAYISSQAWLDKFASALGRLFGLPSVLNLVVLGVLCCVLFALGVTAIVLGLRLSTRDRIIATVLLLLVVADSAFFGYVASVLSEGAAFAGIVLLCGGLLLMNRPGAWRYTGAVVTVLGAMIGINAKTQTLLLLPFFVLALAFVRAPGSRGLARWALPVAVLAVVGTGTALKQGTGDPANAEYREANMYHVVFDSIVDGRHDAAADLAELGLPPEFAKYAGSTWWSANSATKDPSYGRYRDRISRRNVAHFYLTHPLRTVEILHRSAQEVLTARVPNLGSFGEGSGQAPLAKEYRVPVLSGVTGFLAPLGLFFLLPLWLVILWLGVRAFRRRSGRREIGVVTLMLLLFACGQFLASGLGEGIEGVKHQQLTLFPTLLAAVFAGIGLLPRRTGEETLPEPEVAAKSVPGRTT